MPLQPAATETSQNTADTEIRRMKRRERRAPLQLFVQPPFKTNEFDLT